MKSQKGVSLIIWILGVIVLAIIITSAIQYLVEEVDKKTGEDIKTEMLQVQAKAKIVLEKYHVDKNNGLKGEKQEDISLEEIYGISNIGDYYKWNVDTLKEVGLQETILKEDGYYLVNYDTEEIVYSKGYKTKEGSVYYKLSDIKEIK